MKGLLIKDYKYFVSIQLKSYLFMLIGSIGIAFVGVNAVLFYIVIIGSMFVGASIAYDEYDNGYPFLFTLPFDRKQYVREKYALGIITMLVFTGIATGITALVTLIKGNFDATLFLPSILSVLLANSLILCLLVPVQIKFSGQRGMLILAGILMIIVSVGVGIMFIIQWLGFPLSTVLQQIEHTSTSTFVAFGMILSAVTFIISYNISLKIIHKKEF